MYAVIETGGKQYRVQPGDVLDIELLPDLDDDQTTIEFDRVLMVSGDEGVRTGSPVLDGATVKATLLSEVRGPKVRVFKMKRRKGYRRTNGHRQDYLRVKIDDIEV